MKKSVTGLLVVLSICLAVQSSALAEFNIEMAAYLNLLSAPGSQWFYANENGDEAEVEVLNAGPFNGISDAGRIRMITTDAENNTYTTIEYYDMVGDGLYEIGTEEYEGEETVPYLRILLEAPFKKVISLPEMDADADPLESTGQGALSYLGISGDLDYFSSVNVEGTETLVMPYGVFDVLKLTTTQSYTYQLGIISGTMESTSTAYIEPNLGVLALDDENGRMSLTGIGNIAVPGDADDDGDVDGSDLAGAAADGDMVSLARYFGVSVPVVIN
jgi:hypothetical protein